MPYSSYYQAQVVEKDCWFLAAVMRSFEHLSFDRTYDKETSTFEFFVPEGLEKSFLEVMDYFKNEGIITTLIKQPNRLRDPQAVI